MRAEWKAEKSKLKKVGEDATLKYEQDFSKIRSELDSLLQRYNSLSAEHANLQDNFAR